MLMSSFFADGIKIADLISSLGLDEVGVTTILWAYDEPENVMHYPSQICDVLPDDGAVLTCELAWCHLQGPMSPQEPKHSSCWRRSAHSSTGTPQR